MSSMAIKEENGYIWVRLPRIIGTTDCFKLEEELRPCLVDGVRLVLDLVDSGELYSSGLGFLIRIRKLVVELHGAVFIVNVNRKLRELLVSLNLDRVFRMYATDVEFELDNEDVWLPRFAGMDRNFLFVSQIESGLGRAIMSGLLNHSADLNGLRTMACPRDVNYCIFDLTGVCMMDSFGISELLTAFRRLGDSGCRVALFGANSTVSGLFSLFPPSDNVHFYSSEKDALEASGQTI